MSPLRVAVVGAGPAGLTALVALSKDGMDVTCFEKGDRPGGLWAYGAPLSGAYRSLHLNTSRARTELAGFPMPRDWPDFPSHERIGEYFNSYVDAFGVRERIRFDCGAERAERLPGGGWQLSLEDGSSRSFDVLVSASGHNWEPRLPDPPYPGDFDGVQLHAHDYREPDILEDCGVLVVGMGNSAMDIAVESSYVAKSTAISARRGQWVLRKTLDGKPVDQRGLPAWAPWRLKQLGYKYLAKKSGDPTSIGLPQPDHEPGQSHPVQSDRFFDRVADGRITPKPGIERLAGDRVVFTDGTSVPADLIVWCTGYNVTFPFFDPDFVSAPDNDLPLWKRTVHPDIPGLFLVGLLQPLGAVMPLAEAQSRWVAELLTGRYRPPSVRRMRRETLTEHEKMQRRFYASKRHTMEVDFDAYLWDLDRERRRGERRAAKTGAPLPIPPRASAGQRAAVAA